MLEGKNALPFRFTGQFFLSESLSQQKLLLFFELEAAQVGQLLLPCQGFPALTVRNELDAAWPQFLSVDDEADGELEVITASFKISLGHKGFISAVILLLLQ